MKALLLKDFLVVAKQLKIFLLVIPVMAITGGGSVAALAVLMGAVLPMTAIAYDERSRWNEIAAMMPYSKQDLIISKYLLGYICIFGAASLAVAVQGVMMLMGKGNLSVSLNMVLIAVAGALIYIAINTPILFKFGSEKGRFVFIIAMAFIGGLGPILKNVDSNFLISISNRLPFILLLIAVILNILSVSVSKRIKI